MAQGMQFEVTFMDEASEFLRTLADAPRDKIYYNLKKAAGGLIDSDLFKKLDGSDGIWEFRTLYNGLQYRLLAFWDEQEKRLVVRHSWICQEDMESTIKRNCPCRCITKEVLRNKIGYCYGNETSHIG